MIVKIWRGIHYERMVECDTIHKTRSDKTLELSFYNDGKLIESSVFDEKVTAFIMERGRTVDRIDFNPSSTAT